jgi:hypothetical protein
MTTPIRARVDRNSSGLNDVIGRALLEKKVLF